MTRIPKKQNAKRRSAPRTAPGKDPRTPLALLAVEDIAMLLASRKSIWPAIEDWEDVESFWRGEGSRDKAHFRKAAKKWIDLLDTRPENRHG